MAQSLALPHPAHDDTSQPELTNLEAGVLVAIALTHFAFAHGAIWRHPWSPDASIVWSYVPIPFLVALALLRGARLTVTSWFLGTLQVATIKFLISASMLIVMWAATSPAEPIVPSTSRPEPAMMTTSTSLPNASTPIPLSIGVGPARTLHLPVGSRLLVHAGDQRMHTLQLANGPNVPIVPGSERVLLMDEVGTQELSCAVHPHEAHVTVVVATANRP